MVKENRWMDGLSLGFSLAMIALTTVWMLRSNAFDLALADHENWAWYLVRSAGLTAYILMTVAMLWGIAVSSRVVKDWSPGVLSMLLHSTIAWLAVVFTLGHALLLLRDRYFTYTLVDIFVPFTGPYKSFAVGLGILAFWLGLIIALSFRFKKQLGNQTWKYLHYTSYSLYLLITLHALLAGSDAANLGVKLILALGGFSVVLMLGYRLGKKA